LGKNVACIKFSFADIIILGAIFIIQIIFMYKEPDFLLTKVKPPVMNLYFSLQFCVHSFNIWEKTRIWCL